MLFLQLFTFSVPFTSEAKTQQCERTAIIPSGNVSDVGDKSEKRIQKIYLILNQMKKVKVRWREKLGKKLYRWAAQPKAKVTVNHLNQFQQLNLQNSLHLIQKWKRNLIYLGNQRSFNHLAQCDVETVPKNNKRHIWFKRLKSVMVSEIKPTIGIILYMGICKLPNQRMY